MDEPDSRRFDDSARRLDRWADTRIQELRRQAAFTPVRYTERQLLRHTVILGASGSGKTNHAFHLIREANPRSCIIVDVKKEYRELMEVLQREVRVLAFADEPRIRFNPLIVAGDVDPGGWDYAFADIFTRCYGLAEPSRRIILDCLHDLREERKEQPTLRELEKAVARFETGSGKEQASKRSLESRLHIINSGPVGASLNAGEPLDVDAMDDLVVVFEIGRVESLRDERFLAELLLGYLWHRDKEIDAEQNDESLRRLVVIEEAHRYLSEERPPEQRGNRTLMELAVAEGRSYGWGFVIIDQMPTLLSRYVWDNAGTVMAHRLTNSDSFEAVKSALGGNPFERNADDARDPLALRLPEDLAVFRRYIDPQLGGVPVGVTMIPRVTPSKDTEIP